MRYFYIYKYGGLDIIKEVSKETFSGFLKAVGGDVYMREANGIKCYYDTVTDRLLAYTIV